MMSLFSQDDEPPEKKPESSEIKEEVYDDSIDDFHRDDYTRIKIERRNDMQTWLFNIDGIILLLEFLYATLQSCSYEPICPSHTAELEVPTSLFIRMNASLFLTFSFGQCYTFTAL